MGLETNKQPQINNMIGNRKYNVSVNISFVDYLMLGLSTFSNTNTKYSVNCFLFYIDLYRPIFRFPIIIFAMILSIPTAGSLVVSALD